MAQKIGNGAKRIRLGSLRRFSDLREAGPGAWNSVCTQHLDCDRFMYCNVQGFCRYAEDKVRNITIVQNIRTVIDLCTVVHKDVVNSCMVRCTNRK